MAAGDLAVIIELLGVGGDPVRFTVTDGTKILKGELMTVTDPRTIVVSTSDNDPFMGISAADKEASDGATTLAVYTHGIFEINAAAAITVGERVSISGDNEVTKVASADLLFADVGIALETASTDEIIAVLIGSGI